MILKLHEAPGSIAADDGRSVPSPFVVGIERRGHPPLYHRQLEALKGAVTTTNVDLPTPKAEKICELFSRLYSAGPERVAPYDCFAALDFVLGGHKEIVKRLRTYQYVGPIRPRQLQRGEAYLIVPENNVATHGMLAVDSQRVLHVAGPQGGLGHTPAADLLKIWDGQLRRVTRIS